MILTNIYVFTIYRKTLNPKCQTLNPTTLNPRRCFKLCFMVELDSLQFGVLAF